MSNRGFVVLCLSFVLGWVPYGVASSIQFNNESDFASQAGATLHSLPAGIGGVVTEVPSFGTGNGLTFSDASGACGLFTHASGFNSNIPWTLLALCGVENYNVAITGTTYSFGLSVYQPNTPAGNECNAACVHDTFSVTF